VICQRPRMQHWPHLPWRPTRRHGPRLGGAVGYRVTDWSWRASAAANGVGWRSCRGRGDAGAGSPPWGQAPRGKGKPWLWVGVAATGVDPSVINCIKAGDNVSTAKAKAAAGDTTLSGLNASGTPFVWDGTNALNYQDPTWLTKLIG
jgi:hypothetical protein